MADVAVELAAPRVLARPDHAVSRSGMSPAVIKVMYRLHRAGYTAYLVGGAVRDLLLGGAPKDFDVATNARPQEIRRLFRNSRIIGRRFRLVHILFRGEVVEVATFRATPDAPEGPDDWEEAVAEAAEIEAEPARGPAPPQVEHELFGTPADDAWRRDFTVNGLFYDISDFSVIDYVGGLDDLEARLIRTIGDPERRFREDPVRMLRALEYGARLGFELETGTREAIASCADEIVEASPARLSYELTEALRSGHAAPIVTAWTRAGLFERAFPGVLGRADETARALAELDRAVERGERPSDPALLGAFYLHPLYRELADLTDGGRRLDNVEMLSRIATMVEPAATTLRLANHTVHLLMQGLFTLTKMQRPAERGRQVLKLARQDYFPVAWTLYGVSGALGLTPADAHRAWSSSVERLRRDEDPVAEPAEEGGDRPRSRRRRRPRRRRRS